MKLENLKIFQVSRSTNLERLKICKLITKNGKHFYQTQEGKTYPSVTTVLSKTANNKQSLIDWKKRIGDSIANYIVEESKTYGTKTHKLIELYLNNKSLDEVPDLIPRAHFLQLKPYLDKIDNIHYTEIALHSNALRLAGTCDCIAEYEGKFSIIDFKTGRSRKRPEWIQDYFLQATAYAKMYHELTDLKPVQFVILISALDGSAEAHIKNPVDFDKSLNQRVTQYYDS